MHHNIMPSCLLLLLLIHQVLASLYVASSEGQRNGQISVTGQLETQTQLQNCNYTTLFAFSQSDYVFRVGQDCFNTYINQKYFWVGVFNSKNGFIETSTNGPYPCEDLVSITYNDVNKKLYVISHSATQVFLITVDTQAWSYTTTLTSGYGSLQSITYSSSAYANGKVYSIGTDNTGSVLLSLNLATCTFTSLAIQNYGDVVGVTFNTNTELLVISTTSVVLWMDPTDGGILTSFTISTSHVQSVLTASGTGLTTNDVYVNWNALASNLTIQYSIWSVGSAYDYVTNTVFQTSSFSYWKLDVSIQRVLAVSVINITTEPITYTTTTFAPTTTPSAPGVSTTRVPTLTPTTTPTSALGVSTTRVPTTTSISTTVPNHTGYIFDLGAFLNKTTIMQEFQTHNILPLCSGVPNVDKGNLTSTFSLPNTRMALLSTKTFSIGTLQSFIQFSILPNTVGFGSVIESWLYAKDDIFIMASLSTAHTIALSFNLYGLVSQPTSQPTTATAPCDWRLSTDYAIKITLDNDKKEIRVALINNVSPVGAVRGLVQCSVSSSLPLIISNDLIASTPVFMGVAQSNILPKATRKLNQASVMSMSLKGIGVQSPVLEVAPDLVTDVTSIIKSVAIPVGIVIVGIILFVVITIIIVAAYRIRITKRKVTTVKVIDTLIELEDQLKETGDAKLVLYNEKQLQQEWECLRKYALQIKPETEYDTLITNISEMRKIIMKYNLQLPTPTPIFNLLFDAMTVFDESGYNVQFMFLLTSVIHLLAVLTFHYKCLHNENIEEQKKNKMIQVLEKIISTRVSDKNDNRRKASIISSLGSKAVPLINAEFHRRDLIFELKCIKECIGLMQDTRNMVLLKQLSSITSPMQLVNNIKEELKRFPQQWYGHILIAFRNIWAALQSTSTEALEQMLSGEPFKSYKAADTKKLYGYLTILRYIALDPEKSDQVVAMVIGSQEKRQFDNIQISLTAGECLNPISIEFISRKENGIQDSDKRKHSDIRIKAMWDLYNIAHELQITKPACAGVALSLLLEIWVHDDNDEKSRAAINAIIVLVNNENLIHNMKEAVESTFSSLKEQIDKEFEDMQTNIARIREIKEDLETLDKKQTYAKVQVDNAWQLVCDLESDETYIEQCSTLQNIKQELQKCKKQESFAEDKNELRKIHEEMSRLEYTLEMLPKDKLEKMEALEQRKETLVVNMNKCQKEYNQKEEELKQLQEQSKIEKKNYQQKEAHYSTFQKDYLISFKLMAQELREKTRLIDEGLDTKQDTTTPILIEDENSAQEHDVLCPITQELFEDPVRLDETGMVYDRSAIEKWFIEHNKNTDPITGVVLQSKKFTSDTKTLQNVQIWKMKNKI